MAFDYSDPNVRRPIFGPGAGFSGTGMGIQSTGQQLAQSPGTQGATAGGSVPQQQFQDRVPTHQTPSMTAAGRTMPPPQYGQYYAGGNIGNSAPGSRSPTGNPALFPEGFNQAEYPWTQDTSVQWGGGPYGYLPIGYQPQSYDYYAQGASGNVAQGPGVLVNTGTHSRWMPSGGYAQMAPWEQQYMHDTFSQNYDPNAPGYINSRDPSTWPNARG